MTRRTSFVLVLVLVAGLCGCNDTKKLETQVTAFKAEMDPQIQLMTRHSKFLRKKAETISAKVDKIEADQAQINQTLAALSAEPGAAKRDILAFVDAKAETTARFQKSTLQEFGRFLDIYAELLKEIDRLRLHNDDTTAFRERVTALRAQGERVKAILVEEGL